MTTIVFKTRIVKIEQKTRIVGTHRDPKTGETILQAADVGWFIQLSGFNESWFVGEEKPDLIKGESVSVRLETERKDGVSP